MSGTLHLALGDEAARALREAGLVPDGAPMAWQDDISVGRLTPLDAASGGDAAWCAARVAFWREVVAGRPLAGLKGEEASSSVESALPAQLAALRAGVRAADAAILWAGESVQELMFVALVAHVAAQEGAPPERLVLRQYHDDDDDVMDRRLEAPGAVGRARHGVASLGAEALARAPAPAPADADLADELAALWAALTAPTPEPLAAMARALAAAPGRLPGLGPALAARLRRFPDARTGLAAAQALLLEHCEPGWTPSPRLIGAALRDNAGPDRFGDLALFRLLRRMADPAQPDPPVEMRGADRTIAGSSARLTTFGQMILEGDANHWKTNGVDLWVGGVHVSSAEGTVWVCDGDEVIPA